jgi:hypothetical protein
VSTGNDDLDAWKQQRTVTLAFELADSGRYDDFTDVVYALQFEHGLASVTALIDEADMRRALNRRCGTAREALAPPAPPTPPALHADPEPAVRERHAAEPPPLPAFTETSSLLGRIASALGRPRERAVKPVNAGDLNAVS